MKIKMIVAALLMAATAVPTFAQGLTRAQKEAQREVYKFLENKDMKPVVDTSDNSVCFRSGGVLYWVTFTSESPILYTFQRKAYKIGDNDSTYVKEIAVDAVNEVNAKHPGLKLFVDDKKVHIEAQVYAASPAAFTDVMMTYFDEFKNVDVDFKNAYGAAKKLKTAEDKALEEEMLQNMPPSELEDAVKGVSFRLLSEAGEEVTPYDRPLRSFCAEYLQPRVEFGPRTETKDYTLQIRVTRPDGKVIRSADSKFTSEQEIELKKSKNSQVIELDEFGSSKDGFWKAGEYKFEILDAGRVIYTTTFNIL